MQNQTPTRSSGIRALLNTAVCAAALLGFTTGAQAVITQNVGSNYIAWAATNDVTIVNGSPAIWGVTNDASAAGGLALVEQGASDTANVNSTAQWSLVFKTAGTYQMYIRYRLNPCCGGNSYLFPAAFGATPAYLVSKANENGSGPTSYAVLKEQVQNGGALATFTVAQLDVDNATPLVFTIGTREAPGLSIDRIILSTDTTLDASGGAAFNALPNTGAGLSFTVQPSDVALDTGATANFSATAAGGVGPYTYLWYTNGVADTSSGLNSAYAYGPVTNADNGRTFQLVITDANTTSITSRVATLTINPIHFVTQPASLTVPINQPATFSGSAASGAAPYTYQWRTNGIVDPTATTGTYTLTNAGPGENGRTFQLIMTDSGSISITSSVATLTVLSAPGRLAVSFTGRIADNTPSPILNPNEIAGLVPQGYWNNINNSSTFGGASSAFNDGNGVATAVTLTYDANDAWNNDGPNGTPNEKLMKGISKANGANRLNTYTFNNLDNQAYDLICYVNVNGDNRIGDFTANNTPYYVTLQHTYAGSFIESASQNPSARAFGNYVRWNNVIPDSNGRIAMTMVNRGDPDGTGISGFQLIPKGAAFTFSTQPADAANVWPGQPVAFVTQATFGVPPYNYLWITNGAPDPSGAGAGTTYKITPAISDNNRTFQVVVTDSMANSITSRVATLRMVTANPDRSISLNFVGRPDNGYYIGLGDAAGVVPLTNWNNNQASGEQAPSAGNTATLRNDIGETTPVTLHWECNDSWRADNVVVGTDGNTKMMKGFTKDGGTSQGYFQFFNLPPSRAYDVYLYTVVNNGGGLPGNVRYNAWVDSQGNPTAGLQSITNYALMPDQFSGTFQLAQNFNPAGPYPGGHYCKFTNVFSKADGTLLIGHKAVSGGDGAGYPGVQIIRRTDIVIPPPTLVNASLTQTPNPVFEGSPVTLSGLSFTGTGPRSYQWQTNTANDLSGAWVDVIGATSAALTFTPFIADSNRQFRVIGGSSGGSLTSSPIALQVVIDVTAPTLVSALGGATKQSIVLTYSEPMRVSDVTNTANYFVTNLAGAALSVTGGQVLSDGKTVILATAPQDPGAQYRIVITGVRDRAFIPNIITPNPTIASFTAYDLDYLPGQVLFRAYDTGASSGGGMAELTNNPVFPNSPDYATLIPNMNSRSAPAPYNNNSREHYGGTVVGHFIPPVSGNWILYISSDDDGELLMNTNGPSATGAKVVRFAPGCCRALANGSDPTPAISLIAGQAYYIEAQFKEGTGGDYVEVGARLQGDSSTIVVIPSAQLAYLSKLVVTQAVADVTVEEAHTAFFQVGVSVGGAGGVGYQWSRSTDTSGTTFTNLPGATGPSLLTGPAFGAYDDNFKYRVVITSPTKSLTNIATLHVVPDLTAPRLLSASVEPSLRRVTLTFNERMNTNDDGYLSDALSYAFFTNGVPLTLDYTVTNTSPSNVVITLVPGQLAENTVYEVNVCCVSDYNTNGIDFSYSTASFRTPVYSRGFAKYDFYLGITGTTVPILLAAPKYPNSPNVTYLTNNLDWPQSTPDMNDYGLRMSGYFIPPVSGTYTFWFKNDDDGRFSLSTDDQPANLVTVKDFVCCSGNFANSAAVSGLVAGRRYYFEALVKEGGGGDYLTVGVTQPGSSAINPVGSQYIAFPLDASVAPVAGVSQQPQSVTVIENSTAQFTVMVTNSGGLAPFIQWQTGSGGTFTDFVGGYGTNVTTPPIPLAANGLQVRAAIYLPGLTFYSAPATITVLADTNKPVALSAASANGTQIGIRLTELLASATVTDTNNYSVNGQRPLTATLRPEGSNVVLTVATPVGKEFTVVVSNLTDLAATPNVVSNTTLLGKYWIDTVVDIGNPTPAGVHFSGRDGDISISAGGADVWGNTDQFTFAYTPKTNDFDVKVRVDSVQYVGNNWTKAGINARSSTAANAAMVWFYPTPPEGGSHQYEGTIRHTDGAGNVEDFQPRPDVKLPSYLRLIRSGSLYYPYISTNGGTNWNLFGTNAPYAAPELPATLLVGVGTVSHQDGTAATAKFAEFGNTYPTMTTERSGTNLVIRWDGTGVLQYTDDLPAPLWTPVLNATSPYTVPVDQAHRYYRTQRLFPTQ